MDNNVVGAPEMITSAPEQAQPAMEPVVPVPEPKKQNVGKLALIAGVALLVVCGGAFAAMKLLGKKSEPTPEPQKPAEIRTEIEVSGLDLSFLKLEENKANIIYSPLSIKYGVSLLRDGASGTTKAEIEKALGDITLTKYEDVADVLSLANAVIIRNDYKAEVLPEYVTGVEEAYGAEVMYDELKSTAVIDSWVNKKTFGLIQSAGIQITDDTKMLLANALAIQVDWASKFSDDSTHGQDFTRADGTKVEATMMNTTEYDDDINYYVDDEVTVVSKNLKDYNGTQLEYVAIMPEKNLSDYVQEVAAENINTVLAARKSASTVEDGVVLNIPKFKFDYKLQFIDDLNQLGIKTAFTDAADFSLMSKENDLKVGDAVHKATIDFSEDGIKAAAITVFAMTEASAMEGRVPEPLVITIDKPFMFLIRDKKTGENWFVGAVYEPNLWANDQAEYTYKY